MSESEALVTPTINALSARFTVCSAPSLALISSELPLTFSMVPASRCPAGCCAEAEETAKATRATPVKIPILRICFLPLGLCCGGCGGETLAIPSACGLHRRRQAILAVGNVGDVERAVGQFRRGGDEHLRTGLELGLARGLVGDDRGLGRDLDLLLLRLVAALVLDGEHLTVDGRHRLLHRPVGHERVGHQIPTEVHGVDVLLGREDVHLDGRKAAVGLRRGGDAHLAAGLDVGDLRRNDRAHHRIVLELELELGAVARLDGDEVAVDAFDRPTHAHVLRLLGEARAAGEREGKAGGAKSAPRDVTHFVLPSPALRSCRKICELRWRSRLFPGLRHHTPTRSASTSARKPAVTSGRVPKNRMKAPLAWYSSIPRPSAAASPRARAVASNGVASGEYTMSATTASVARRARSTSRASWPVMPKVVVFTSSRAPASTSLRCSQATGTTASPNRARIAAARSKLRLTTRMCRRPRSRRPKTTARA